MLKQAIILSAGLGTRLRPLTDKIPKVMILIGGKPLSEHNIEQFKKYGVSEFFINLHHLPGVIRGYFGDGSKWGVKITYHFEPELLGTAGGVKSFEQQLDDEFFVMYGDIFSLVDYSKYYEYWKTKSDAIGMQRVGDTENPWSKDLVEVDDELRFVKIHPKPRSRNSVRRVSYAPSSAPKRSQELAEFSLRGMRGIFILKKRILEYVPANTYYEIGSQLLPDILAKGEKFYGYECEDYSVGIDTLEVYQKAQERYQKS